MRIFAFLLVASLVICSCGKDQEVEDQALIEDYVANSSKTFDVTPEGIYYSLDGQGTSVEMPNINSVVKVDYTGYFLDGEQFDSNLPGDPIEFGLTQVIEGWGLGLQLFQRGESGTLVIPSRYAYGSSGRGSIPGNSVLVFDIKLYDF